MLAFLALGEPLENFQLQEKELSKDAANLHAWIVLPAFTKPNDKCRRPIATGSMTRRLVSCCPMNLALQFRYSASLTRLALVEKKPSVAGVLAKSPAIDEIFSIPLSNNYISQCHFSREKSKMSFLWICLFTPRAAITCAQVEVLPQFPIVDAALAILSAFCSGGLRRVPCTAGPSPWRISRRRSWGLWGSRWSSGRTQSPS